MIKDPAFARFCWQRNTAKYRGIGWYFTFEEWVAWWVKNLGPNWMAMRGTRRGQYMMARKGDEGPYHPDNVCCLVRLQNDLDAHRYAREKGKPWHKSGTMPYGEGHRNSKITEQAAKEIYLSCLGAKRLGRRYGISPTQVRDIKNGKWWKHVTENLTRPSSKPAANKKPNISRASQHSLPK